jgi:hypothetical protein
LIRDYLATRLDGVVLTGPLVARHPYGMSEPDAFVKKVEAELREIGRREMKLSEQEDTIKRQRVELRGRSVELTRTLNVYKQVMGVGTAAEQPAPSTAETPNVDGTIADVAASLLATHGGPMTTNQIVGKLQQVGKLKGGGASGRGDYGTVYRTLLRDPRFVRVDKGIFGLVPQDGG